MQNLKHENQELREMLIQNGLFMRITNGLHKLGFKAPPDMKEKSLLASVKSCRAMLDAQAAQAHKMEKTWKERGARVADQERRTHHCLAV